MAVLLSYIVVGSLGDIIFSDHTKSSRLRLRLRNVLFLLDIPSKFIFLFFSLISQISSAGPAHLILLFVITVMIFDEEPCINLEKPEYEA